MKFSISNQGRVAVLAAAFALTIAGTGCKKTIDDATLKNDIQAKLNTDLGADAQGVDTQVANGTVVLSGGVGSEAARTLAAKDAAGVAGVKQVINNLTLGNSAAPTAMTPGTAMTAEPSAPEPVAPVAPKKAVVKQKPVKAPAPAPVQRVAPPPVQQAYTEAPVKQAPPPPPGPTFRNVTLTDSVLPVRLTQTLETGQIQEGDTFSGVLASDVIQDGLVVLRRGATVHGRVVEAKDAAHFKGSASLSIQLVSLSVKGSAMPITTDTVTKEGKGRGKNTATKAGVGAAAGAILGGIFGGGKGAAIGAAAGGGTGVGINAVTRGEQVQLPAETILRFHLQSPVTVRVNTGDTAAQQ